MTHRIAYFGQSRGKLLVINSQAQMGSTLQQPNRPKKRERLHSSRSSPRRGSVSLTTDRIDSKRPSSAQEVRPNADQGVDRVRGIRSAKLSIEASLQGRPQSNNAMPKILESVSNTSTNSARPIQFRSINGTKVLALVLLLVISGLSAVFLLLQ
jgi:hypothetical protein